ncbi:hypothetical protein DPMN_145859 [Dreissena polymorpha]|uniref:Uncharacterized protein n=1 Tax=Dreissena polymorpha TaxID=45954 RepID=A0A9D4J1G5_DREPO|nr:hypothetical protein DPMN_145859 [Dreissena polymorpha]
MPPRSIRVIIFFSPYATGSRRRWAAPAIPQVGFFRLLHVPFMDRNLSSALHVTVVLGHPGRSVRRRGNSDTTASL